MNNFKVFFSRQYLTFLLISASAAALHWTSRILLSIYMSFSAAVTASFFVGLAAAFILNLWFVFPDSQLNRASQIRRFLFVNAITMPLVWLTAVVLYHAFVFISDIWWREAVAHGIAVALPAISSFVAYKLFVFK